MPALIAALVQGILWIFKSKFGYMIAAAMVWLGINFATLKVVIQPTIDLLTGFAQGGGGQGGGEYWAMALSWMGVLNFDKALTMVISAYATRNAMGNARLFLMKRGA